MEQPTYASAVLLSFAGGVLTILSATVFSFLHIGLFPHMESMMGGSQIVNNEIFSLIPRVVIGSGIIVGSYLMYSKPDHIRISGIVVLILSIIGFIGFGGYQVGAIFSIVGGMLGMFRKK